MAARKQDPTPKPTSATPRAGTGKSAAKSAGEPTPAPKKKASAAPPKKAVAKPVAKAPAKPAAKAVAKQAVAKTAAAPKKAAPAPSAKQPAKPKKAAAKPVVAEKPVVKKAEAKQPKKTAAAKPEPKSVAKAAAKAAAKPTAKAPKKSAKTAVLPAEAPAANVQRVRKQVGRKLSGIDSAKPPTAAAKPAKAAPAVPPAPQEVLGRLRETVQKAAARVAAAPRAPEPAPAPIAPKIPAKATAKAAAKPAPAKKAPAKAAPAKAAPAKAAAKSAAPKPAAKKAAVKPTKPAAATPKKATAKAAPTAPKTAAVLSTSPAAPVAPPVPVPQPAPPAPQPPPAPAGGEGPSRLVLLARDPDWLYAYWDINAADRLAHQIGSLRGAPLLLLRVTALPALAAGEQSLGFFDLVILPDGTNWLIEVPRIERDWRAELGYIGRDGHFVTICQSNRVQAPWLEQRPATAPLPPQASADIPAADVAAGLPQIDHEPAERGTESAWPVETPEYPAEQWPLPPMHLAEQAAALAAVAERLAAERLHPPDARPQPPPAWQPPALRRGTAEDPSPASGAEPAWSPTDALLQLLQPQGAGFAPHWEALPTPAGSSEQAYAPVGGELPLAAGLEARAPQPASVPFGELAVPGSAPHFRPGGDELFVPGAGEAPAPALRQRGFWMHVHCDLIVYGATEPDARVTVQGVPVELRPDGTFTLRFTLPDGEQVIPVSATSADEVDTLTITPIVTRRTE